jgi:glycosyltransferase involved in cell wall biosynthesis
MRRLRVCLTGGDDINWAIDEDLRLMREALEPFADFVDLPDAEVIHCVWWNGLLNLPRAACRIKPLICHMPGQPFRYLTLPEHNQVMDRVDLWIARSRQAFAQLRSLGYPVAMLPYLVDLTIFRPLSRPNADVEALRARWNIPADRFLIGSFQRDTEGSDLRSPKLVKGPDVFLEIVTELFRRDCPIHAVLAGPRRHWLIQRLSARGVPFTYTGRPVDHDDLDMNTMPRPTLNLLYNLVDLVLVASRSEGGPHAVMEAAASRCTVLSSRVGAAPDVLEASAVFDAPHAAVDLMEEHIRYGILDETVQPQYERVTALQREVREKGGEVLYSNVARTSRHNTRPDPIADPIPRDPAGLTVSLWHTFHDPPYGGGNQFMLALRKALQHRGVNVVENELHANIDAYILNSIHFDVDQFRDAVRNRRLAVLHRIDGPIHLIRGFDREKDERCFRLNQEFAGATVLQSAWSFARIVEMGYRPVHPVIIHNAADPGIFSAGIRLPFSPTGPIRLISSSWSDNPRKGAALYTWLDTHLDWNRFAYTFAGNVASRLRNMHTVPPVASEELAELLRGHHIFVTASRNDPCSNAVIEALSCGLPVLYLNDGGHPELVGFGGLPFHGTDDVIPQLEALCNSYEMIRRLIVAPDMDHVVERYLTLLLQLVA